MADDNKTEIERVTEDTKQKTVYSFDNGTITVKSKEVDKIGDKITFFPFFIDLETQEAKPKYKKIKSIALEDFRGVIPAGLYKTATRGYGFTRTLSPLRKFIESNLDAETVTISKKRKSQLSGSILTINYQDYNKLRNFMSSVSRNSRERNKTYINNYFAQLFPTHFSKESKRYSKGLISSIINEHDNLGKKLSTEDKTELFGLFERLSLSQKNVFENQALISTKEKIEEKYIEDILREFDRLLNLERIREEKWQDFFKLNSWIFSQLFAHPTVFIQDKAYVGGYSISAKGGKYVDFLYANKLTKNAALIEIKKHTTKPLRKKPYRGTDVHTISNDLSGAINQILDQKDNLVRKFESIRADVDVESFNPKCIIIIGRIKDLDPKQHKSFELFRSGMKDVEILTFDELYERIKSILEIFKSKEDKAGTDSRGKKKK